MPVQFTSHKVERLQDIQSKIARALEVIGGTAEGYAKLICPVGTPESTGIPGYIGGTLRNSIAHEIRSENTVAVGTNVHYAPFVELGTRKMRAQPYLRPAVENHREEYEKIIKQELSS